MPRGRPSKFDQGLIDKMVELATKGATDDQIAEALGVASSTFRLWKGKVGGLSAAIKKAKNISDELVEASLYRRATGYSHPAVKAFLDKESGTILTTEYTEYYAPDTLACIFWLKNRQPDKWREKRVHEHSGPNGDPIQTQKVAEETKEEKEKRINAKLEKLRVLFRS